MSYQQNKYFEIADISEQNVQQLVDAPWYFPNILIHNDLKIPTIKEFIKKLQTKENKTTIFHENPLIAEQASYTGGEKHKYPADAFKPP